MKVTADCVPCLMKRILFQSRLVDGGREFESVRAGMAAYNSVYSREANSAKAATLAHRASYDALGVDDPYLELKLRADEAAVSVLPDAEAFIDASDDRLAAAVKVAIAGNVMDFGSGIALDDPAGFSSMFSGLLAQGIGHDETSDMEKLLSEASAVIYVFDNCGESVLDRLLIREIRAKGIRVVAVVRGEAILNDVSYEDALRIGIDKDVDRLLTTGCFAIGIDMDRIDDDLREEFSKADLVITKGMANFESLSDESLDVPVVYLFRSKCKPVATAAGVPMGVNVVKIQYPIARN